MKRKRGNAIFQLPVYPIDYSGSFQFRNTQYPAILKCNKKFTSRSFIHNEIQCRNSKKAQDGCTVFLPLFNSKANSLFSTLPIFTLFTEHFFRVYRPFDIIFGGISLKNGIFLFSPTSYKPYLTKNWKWIRFSKYARGSTLTYVKNKFETWK